jgi:hypothetical protein
MGIRTTGRGFQAAPATSPAENGLGSRFGEARKVVLKHLGNHFGRVFANHWEFVRFAQEQQLDLDLTSPPKRWRRP